jgi:hypothetical protein
VQRDQQGEDVDAMSAGFRDAIQQGWVPITAQVNTAGGGVARRPFALHPDQLPTLREGLAKAQDELNSILTAVPRIRSIPAPADDDVSVEAVKRIRERAGEGPGCLTTAVKDSINRFQDMIDQIDAAMKTYNQAEDANRKRLT